MMSGRSRSAQSLNRLHHFIHCRCVAKRRFMSVIILWSPAETVPMSTNVRQFDGALVGRMKGTGVRFSHQVRVRRCFGQALAHDASAMSGCHSTLPHIRARGTFFVCRSDLFSSGRSLRHRFRDDFLYSSIDSEVLNPGNRFQFIQRAPVCPTGVAIHRHGTPPRSNGSAAAGNLIANTAGECLSTFTPKSQKIQSHHRVKHQIG